MESAQVMYIKLQKRVASGKKDLLVAVVVDSTRRKIESSRFTFVR